MCRVKGRRFIALFKLHSIRWFTKTSVWSSARQQSVFQQYRSEKHLPEFYPQDGGESQLGSKLRHYVFHFLHSFVRVHQYCNKTRLSQTEERAIFRVTIDGRAVNYVCGECIASTVEPPRGDRRKYGQQARPSMSIDSTTNLPWRSLDFETVPDALPAAQPTASKHWRHFQTV